MTRKGGSRQACASCKYQRRRCTAECTLAPYFPADQPDMFHNAHRLFGVSNITKLLKQIDPSQRGVAMKSIIDEANARAKYPVYGCVAEIQQLMFKIQLAEEELMAVHAQLSFYRQQHREISVAAAGPSGFALFQQDIEAPPPQPPIYCNAAATNNSPCWIQQQHCGNGNNNNNNNYNPMMMMMMQQPQMGCSVQPITLHQENIHQDDYDDELHPFFDTIDDRQSYIDSKEAYESSSESSLKDIAQSVEHVSSQNDLKSAAACFTLTSVNL